ncbi:cytochrome d ubiquinol oxidase subunit II [Rickettsiales bacterium]|nr:cytochrome d ubiquinol oxidase subunit II [Rickettsiales bacterium]
MIDFSNFLDLPLIWGGLIATAILLYVLLDGFDLGCGILFPFAPSDKCRSKIMNSIAPFWDGNETWLVLGAGGLFVAFPPAYSIIMSAFYMPIILMLVGLIFRGVAFEFRFKSHNKKQQKIWDTSFHFGSILAAFMQGIILGNFIQGVEVIDRSYAGGSLDWVNGFAILTGISMIFGYALLGGTWLIMKTDKETQNWARKACKYVLIYVGIFMTIITITMPFIDKRIVNLWFSLPNILLLAPIPIISIIAFFIIYFDLNKSNEVRPFLLTLLLFFLSYLGICISLYPWIVPFEMNVWQAAAAPTSQSIVLIGVVLFLPVVLTYTGYVYYVFRGKSNDKAMY